MVEPEEVKESKKEWVNNDVDPITKFLNDFEFIRDPDAYVLSSVIDGWLKDSKIGISMRKFGKDLKKHCKLNHYDFVENKVKRIQVCVQDNHLRKRSVNKQNRQVWCGIKAKGGCCYDSD